MNKKTVVITGALGQDGTILSKIFLSKKFKVIGFIRKKKYLNKLRKVTYVTVNLENKTLLKKKIIECKPSILIHLASDNPSYLEGLNTSFYKKNFKSTKNLIDATVETNKKIKILFSNSSQIFGKVKKKVNENTNFTQTSYYTKFRIKANKYILKLKNKYKLNYTNLILFNHDSVYRNKKFLISRIVKAYKKKDYKFLQQLYNLNICGDFSHAEDVCKAIYLLSISKKNPNNLILSSNKVTKISKIILHIFKISNKKVPFNLPRLSAKKVLLGNNSFAKRLLLWRPQKNIFIAVNEMLKIKSN
jgi:GDP-D-mannose dehydratase